jgi:hypothetical protein
MAEKAANRRWQRGLPLRLTAKTAGKQSASPRQETPKRLHNNHLKTKTH